MRITTDILQKTPITLYAFEYKFIPTLINNFLNKSISQLDFFINGFADKEWILKMLSNIKMCPGFEWDAFRADFIQNDVNAKVIVYTFPKPNRMPLAKYGAIVVNESEISYYSLELSERSNFSEALINGVEIKTEEGWVLGMTSIENGHSNLGLVDNCNTPIDFIRLLVQKGLINIDPSNKAENPHRTGTNSHTKTQNKYHISDDGNVYKVNNDGSFTSMGNIESKKNSRLNNSNGLINQDNQDLGYIERQLQLDHGDKLSNEQLIEAAKYSKKNNILSKVIDWDVYGECCLIIINRFEKGEDILEEIFCDMIENITIPEDNEPIFVALAECKRPFTDLLGRVYDELMNYGSDKIKHMLSESKVHRSIIARNVYIREKALSLNIISQNDILKEESNSNLKESKRGCLTVLVLLIVVSSLMIFG